MNDCNRSHLVCQYVLVTILTKNLSKIQIIFDNEKADYIRLLVVPLSLKGRNNKRKTRNISSLKIF